MYAYLFYFSAFVAFYAVHGVLRERKYELYVQVLAILIILVYCIAEYAKNVKGHNDVKLVSGSLSSCKWANAVIYFLK